MEGNKIRTYKMKTQPKLTEIVTTENKKLTVTRFFGSDTGDLEYFARVKDDLYHRIGDRYRLLKKDYYKRQIGSSKWDRLPYATD